MSGEGEQDTELTFRQELGAQADKYDRRAAAELDHWDYLQSARWRGRAEGLRDALDILDELGLQLRSGLVKDDVVQLADLLVAMEPDMAGVKGTILSVTPGALDAVHVMFANEEKGRILPAVYVVKV